MTYSPELREAYKGYQRFQHLMNPHLFNISAHILRAEHQARALAEGSLPSSGELWDELLTIAAKEAEDVGMPDFDPISIREAEERMSSIDGTVQAIKVAQTTSNPTDSTGSISVSYREYFARVESAGLQSTLGAVVLHSTLPIIRITIEPAAETEIPPVHAFNAITCPAAIPWSTVRIY